MLTLDHVKQVEQQVMAICTHCTTLEEIQSASAPLWDWACHALRKNIKELRHEIETHEANEHFPSHFLQEKDHLLKLPLVLLEKLNQK